MCLKDYLLKLKCVISDPLTADKLQRLQSLSLSSLLFVQREVTSHSNFRYLATVTLCYSPSDEYNMASFSNYSLKAHDEIKWFIWKEVHVHCENELSKFPKQNNEMSRGTESFASVVSMETSGCWEVLYSTSPLEQMYCNDVNLTFYPSCECAFKIIQCCITNTNFKCTLYNTIQ